MRTGESGILSSPVLILNQVQLGQNLIVGETIKLFELQRDARIKGKIQISNRLPTLESSIGVQLSFSFSYCFQYAIPATMLLVFIVG